MHASEDVDSSPKTQSQPSHQRGWIVAIAMIVIAALLCLALWLNLSRRSPKEQPAAEAGKESGTATSVDIEKSGPPVETVTVSASAPAAKFSVTGTVEPNQQQLQQITPLVSGRVENVYAALGDHVTRGQLLVRIDSPQVAELHGKLHEAETRLRLAKATLHRVQQAANRVYVLKAKATLDESQANLKRTKQLVSEGLTARKDLVAAESDFQRAQAEYNFQKDISLNKEVSEAKAELSTAETESEHIRDGLRALDARLPQEGEGAEHDISTIELRSPIAGTVIERNVNPGAGFEQGKPLLTIANTKTLWVIANVPEKQMALIRLGMPASIVLEGSTVIGRVSYIDPRLNEDTRTSRVRIAIDNSGENIQVGSFAQIEFSNPVQTQASIFVPEAAVQNVDGKLVVFGKKNSGGFVMLPVTAGPAVEGLVPIFSGLRPGQIVAANGAFILKSKLLKDKFEDQD